MGSELYGASSSSPSEHEVGLSNFFDSGFTPTFYMPPYFDAKLLADPRAQFWSVANDRHYNEAPAAGAQVLSAEQAAHARTLTSLCLGDEDQFNQTIIDAWGAWTRLAHEQVSCRRGFFE